jgi:hypothetical protein
MPANKPLEMDRPPTTLCFATPSSLPATQGQRWKVAETNRRGQVSASDDVAKGRLSRRNIKVASDHDRMATAMKVACQYVNAKLNYDSR